MTPVWHSIGQAGQQELAQAVGVAKQGAHAGARVNGHPLHICERAVQGGRRAGLGVGRPQPGFSRIQEEQV